MHVLVGLDLAEHLLTGDQLVQLELARLVKVEQLRYVVHEVAVTRQGAADLPVVGDQRPLGGSCCARRSGRRR